MLKGEAIQLNFRQLTVICVNLNCTLNEILVLKEMNLTPSLALEVLKVWMFHIRVYREGDWEKYKRNESYNGTINPK